MDYRQYTTINPQFQSVKPCVKGTKSTVGDALGFYAAGMTEQQVLDDHPELSPQSLRACFAYAAAAQDSTQSLAM